MTKILITGLAGIIGSHLCKRLINVTTFDEELDAVIKEEYKALLRRFQDSEADVVLNDLGCSL